jgi:hypothetical protein
VTLALALALALLRRRSLALLRGRSLALALLRVQSRPERVSADCGDAS